MVLTFLFLFYSSLTFHGTLFDFQLGKRALVAQSDKEGFGTGFTCLQNDWNLLVRLANRKCLDLTISEICLHRVILALVAGGP